jgi:hypothetical protein
LNRPPTRDRYTSIQICSRYYLTAIKDNIPNLLRIGASKNDMKSSFGMDELAHRASWVVRYLTLLQIISGKTSSQKSKPNVKLTFARSIGVPYSIR